MSRPVNMTPTAVPATLVPGGTLPQYLRADAEPPAEQPRAAIARKLKQLRADAAARHPELQAAVDVAKQQHAAAREAFVEAEQAMHAANAALSGSYTTLRADEAKLERVLRESADPAIDEMVRDLTQIEDRITERSQPRIYVADANRVLEVVRRARDEVTALRTAEFEGSQLRNRLRVVWMKVQSALGRE